MTRTELIDRLVGVFIVVVGTWGAVESFRRDEPGLAVLFLLLMAGPGDAGAPSDRC